MQPDYPLKVTLGRIERDKAVRRCTWLSMSMPGCAWLWLCAWPWLHACLCSAFVCLSGGFIISWEYQALAHSHCHYKSKQAPHSVSRDAESLIDSGPTFCFAKVSHFLIMCVRTSLGNIDSRTDRPFIGCQSAIMSIICFD